MPLAKLLISLLYLHHVSTQEAFFPSFQSPFGDVKLTSERGGPPPGAMNAPIKVVSFHNKPSLSSRPSNRPLIGNPPPPPPLQPKPNMKPRPVPPVAPPPLPVPLPINQGIPQKHPMSGNIPHRPRPPAVIVVTPAIVVKPDLETVTTTSAPPSTITPNNVDSQPAYYQRFIQNDDGSYYFDFAAPNSVQRLEQGFFKHEDPSAPPILVKTGAYAFISPEGNTYRIDYVADEKGYRPFLNETKLENDRFTYETSENTQ